jgi:mono/diheme cytochrome c family protein
LENGSLTAHAKAAGTGTFQKSKEDSMRMGKRIKPAVLLISPALWMVALNFSAAVPAEKGNQAKGRYYFRQTCKTCHTKGAPGGEITPMSKTMAQWKNYFAAAKHSKGSEPLTKVLPPEQIRDVNAYVVEHAADSLQPETCGK